MSKHIPHIHEISLSGIIRIDIGMEGDWSPTVTTVWTKAEGFLSFANVKKSHKEFKPSLELYFENSWVGIHCFERTAGENRFDETYAKQIIDHVAGNCGN